MNHDETRLVAYLAGDLAGDEEERFDAHLLSCTRCSQAVEEDRRGRRLVAGLGAPLDAGSRQRLESALKTVRPTPTGHRLRWVALAAALLILVVGVAGGVSAGLSGHREHESAETPMEVVAELIGTEPGAGTATVETVIVDGATIVIARSTGPFTMPANSRPAGDRSADTWVAERDGLSVVCVTPREGPSVLVASTLPPPRLLELIADDQLL